MSDEGRDWRQEYAECHEALAACQAQAGGQIQSWQRAFREVVDAKQITIAERDRLRELLREAAQAIECESTGYSCLRARIREALGEGE